LATPRFLVRQKVFDLKIKKKTTVLDLKFVFRKVFKKMVKREMMVTY